MNLPINKLVLPTAILLTAFVGEAVAFGYPPTASTASTSSSRPAIKTKAVQATGWAPNTFMSPAERHRIKNTHILLRPNRPLHFYGNTVRFLHYRRAAR